MTQVDTIGCRECLEAVLLTSPHASASIVRKSTESAEELDELVAVLFAEDLGKTDNADLFAQEEVCYMGQVVGIVLAMDRASCLEAREKVEIEYHATPGVLDVEHAKAVRYAIGEERSLERGDPGKGLEDCELLVEGKISVGSQYPMGCGVLMAVADPVAGGLGIHVQVPTENPSAVRTAVAEVTGISQSRVVVEGLSILGSSGGRGEESVRVASLAALAAMKLRQAVRLELDEEQELLLTGKRHAVEAGFRAGCDKSGLINALDIDLVMDGGAEIGNSRDVLDQAILHADGVYGIENFRVRGHLCRTNGWTGSSIPLEGPAQGILVMEEIIGRVARKVDKSADAIRELNFYRTKKKKARTAYGQKIDAELLSRFWIASLSSAKLHQRREEIEGWNKKRNACKRGIAAVPIKVGIGDPDMTNNQASACVQAFPDGSVRVKVARADLGDGLLSRVSKQVSEALGVREEKVEVTGGEDGLWNPSMNIYIIDVSALVQGAVKDACGQLNDQLGIAKKTGDKGDSMNSFAARVSEVERKGGNLTAFGFYRQSGKDWDGEQLQGSPFSGFYYGAAVVEVELDAFTGEVQVLQADLFSEGIESDCADLERAEISRAYTMGQGWMLNENANGLPYTIPGFEEFPIVFRTEWIDVGGRSGKHEQYLPCVGAPVAMVAATREALKEAIFACSPESRSDIELPVPAEPFVVMRALRTISRKAVMKKREKSAEGKEAEKEQKGEEKSGSPE